MTQYTQKIELCPTRVASVQNVVLHLNGTARLIGRLDSAAGGIFYTKRTVNHLHRVSNSLGLNYEFLSRYPFRWVNIDYDGRRLVTTKNYFLKNGKVLNFSKAGFELQVFLPLEKFGRDTALEFERTSNCQPHLFPQDAA